MDKTEQFLFLLCITGTLAHGSAGLFAKVVVPSVTRPLPCLIRQFHTPVVAKAVLTDKREQEIIRQMEMRLCMLWTVHYVIGRWCANCFFITEDEIDKKDGYRRIIVPYLDDESLYIVTENAVMHVFKDAIAKEFINQHSQMYYEGVKFLRKNHSPTLKAVNQNYLRKMEKLSVTQTLLPSDLSAFISEWAHELIVAASTVD